MDVVVVLLKDGIKLICNNAMRQYLSKISMNTVSPKDSYSIWRKFAQDGRPYWGTGDFCGMGGLVPGRGCDLTQLEWDGNEVNIDGFQNISDMP